MAIKCLMLLIATILLLADSLYRYWHPIIKPPKRSSEFLKVDTATADEQHKFNLLQLRRDIVTDEMNEILRDVIGYTNSDKASQLFAILMNHAERLVHLDNFNQALYNLKSEEKTDDTANHSST